MLLRLCWEKKWFFSIFIIFFCILFTIFVGIYGRKFGLILAQRSKDAHLSMKNLIRKRNLRYAFGSVDFFSDFLARLVFVLVLRFYFLPVVEIFIYICQKWVGGAKVAASAAKMIVCKNCYLQALGNLYFYDQALSAQLWNFDGKLYYWR